MTTSWALTVDFTKADLDDDSEADPKAARARNVAAAAAMPNRRPRNAAIVFRRRRGRDALGARRRQVVSEGNALVVVRRVFPAWVF